MFGLYSFLIILYYIAAHIAAVFNAKAALWLGGRKNQLSRIRPIIESWKNNRIIWIHAASLGEFEMSRPIIEALSQKNSNLRFVISFHSPSGYENVFLTDAKILKIYLPLDLYNTQSTYVKLIKPHAVLFIKYEFWFNLLRVLRDRRIRYYYSSLHLLPDSYLFYPVFRPFLRLIQNSACIYAHNALSAEILKAHDFSRVSILGDTRINRSLSLKEKGIVVKWHNSKPVIAFGSIQEEEIDFVIEFINSNNDLNIILAPHDVEPGLMARIEAALTKPFIKYSDYKNSANQSPEVLLIDTMGDLKLLYRSSTIAYIGGGFKKGPHNIIEPLVFGNIVLSGPNIKKFPMAQLLNKRNLLYIVNKADEFHEVLAEAQLRRLDAYRAASRHFLEENKAELQPLIEELTHE